MQSACLSLKTKPYFLATLATGVLTGLREVAHERTSSQCTVFCFTVQMTFEQMHHMHRGV